MGAQVQPSEDGSALAKQIDGLSFSELSRLWLSRDVQQWSTRPVWLRAFLERLLALGEPLLAYDIASAAHERLPDDVRISQLLGLALARMGSTAKAAAVMTDLVNRGQDDEETLGILARSLKDHALRETEPARSRMLLEAANLYLKTYQKTGGFWPAVNAATLSLLSDNIEQAKTLATEVQRCCFNLGQAALKERDRFWVEASKAEAALIRGDTETAIENYAKARTFASNRYADVASARKNARLLVEKLHLDWSPFSCALAVPSVGVFSGHMIDAPGRLSPRFPESQEDRVKSDIGNAITELEIDIAYSSAACGSDILFIEAMLEANKEVNIVLPYSAPKFRQDSVERLGGARWGERFDRALRNAATVEIASGQPLLGGPTSFNYANNLVLGLARLRAERLGSSVVGVAVWDGTPKGPLGGTSDAVAQWRRIGINHRVIRVARSHNPKESPSSTAKATPSRFKTKVCGLLFADMVGFSKLTEVQIPCFITECLGRIAGVMKLSEHKPVFKNTWGDGLYFVFDTAASAGNFALELRRCMQALELGASELPPTLALRIGLHAGPVYVAFDPIVSRNNYFGTHVSRAARIEPITPPGEIYTSQAFAALAAAEGAAGIICEYVGQTPQAKNYGTFATYLLRPSRSWTLP